MLATSAPTVSDPAFERRVEDLLSQMTIKEKIALLSGQDSWNTVPIPRLGIPSITMTDGPHGVRTQADPGRIVSPATSFPTGVSMAASWDPELIERVGQALADETLALGCDILLGPCVNIVRHPLAGRNFESYSEDPYLAGAIGSAWVKGLQERGVGASLKHYAANNQEIERDRGSSELDERTLREIYLPAFERIVKEADPWTVMCSYNRINGVYASQNEHLLREILKDEWGYPGVVVSDWGANHTVVDSMQAGLDLEMPGPAKYYGQLLLEAVHRWQIELEAVDEAARRMLRLILRSGRADEPRPAGSVNTPEHAVLACELAEESMTLLKNDGGVLPVNQVKVRKLALIGPNADEARIGGGGSSYLEPPYRVSPLQGLRERFGANVQVEYERGVDNFVELPVIRTDAVKAGDGEENGFKAEFFGNTSFSGEPVVTQVDKRLDFWWFNFAPYEGVPNMYSARWTGRLSVAESGRYKLGYNSSGTGRVRLDGKTIIEQDAGFTAGSYVAGLGRADLDLEAGREYVLEVEYAKKEGDPFTWVKVMFAQEVDPANDPRFERAVELARNSDLVVFCGGMPEGFESEGGDRPHMRLPGRQNELIEAIAAVNPNLVVVLNAGSPVEMPWAERVPAIIEAYYPGQEAGNALARVLAGDVNPSGRLTVTFPRRLEDTPAFINYPGGRKVVYGEGIFVGYRYYDARQVEPLFPFGHGLSYTSFEYGKLQAPERVKAGETVRLSVEVRNSGERTGKEVVQLYVADRQASLPRPPKELKGFAKIELQPGESRVVEFELDARAFSFYDPLKATWTAEPGEFEVQVGASSRDIRARAVVVLE